MFSRNELISSIVEGGNVNLSSVYLDTLPIKLRCSTYLLIKFVSLRIELLI